MVASTVGSHRVRPFVTEGFASQWAVAGAPIWTRGGGEVPVTRSDLDSRWSQRVQVPIWFCDDLDAVVTKKNTMLRDARKKWRIAVHARKKWGSVLSPN
ncbi:hypothetical protein DEO72_LG8g2355 [Vigna unguiculata]|uniref:Uncharacterized protein n=1 Tax=Vigna unguiculata TaxID=3917 RepID=A0A4D6MW41_VIGUN|nr:hypothetical protein DEO72_LG8g2355 [Vigna unguiculata]